MVVTVVLLLITGPGAGQKHRRRLVAFFTQVKTFITRKGKGRPPAIAASLALLSHKELEMKKLLTALAAAAALTTLQAPGCEKISVAGYRRTPREILEFRQTRPWPKTA